MERKTKLQVMVLPLLTILAQGLAENCQPLRPTLKTFKKLPLDDVEVTQDSLSVVSVTSELDCGRQCVGVEGCVMVTFKANQTDPSGHCQMYGQLPNDTMSRQSSLGARSYGINDSERCDNGYSMLCGQCLRYLPTPMNYTQAQEVCQQLSQGHLVVVKTIQELECVVDNSGIGRQGSSFLWFGVDDLAVAGRYVWHDGSCLPLNSELWKGRQPNQSRDTERCLVARRVDKRLHDHLCDKEFNVMCHRDL